MSIYEELAKRIDYDPVTGTLTWNHLSAYKVRGKTANSLNDRGYIRLHAKEGKTLYAHRLIYYIMTGEVPEEVDHINRNRSDNRWCNLRHVTTSQNRHNSSPHSDSVVPYKNVTFDKSRNKYLVNIMFNGKSKYIGRYNTVEEAKINAEQARTKYHGEYAPIGGY